MRYRLIKIFVFISVFLTFGIVIFVGVRKQDSRACEPVFSLDESKAKIYFLDKQTAQFASSTVELMGRSTEGGVQITFLDRNSKKIVDQRFYGETGRSHMRFYFEGNIISSIVKLNITYEVPITVDNNVSIKSTEEKGYYLDANGKVCGVDVDGVAQPVEADAQEMIKEYIAGIK